MRLFTHMYECTVWVGCVSTSSRHTGCVLSSINDVCMRETSVCVCVLKWYWSDTENMQIVLTGLVLVKTNFSINHCWKGLHLRHVSMERCSKTEWEDAPLPCIYPLCEAQGTALFQLDFSNVFCEQLFTMFLVHKTPININYKHNTRLQKKDKETRMKMSNNFIQNLRFDVIQNLWIHLKLISWCES